MNELTYETTGNAGGAIMLNGQDIVHITRVDRETALDAAPDSGWREMTDEEFDSILALVVAAIQHGPLIAEALDSHAYWQLSSEWNRNDGYVMDADEEDEDTAAEIKLAEALGEVFTEPTRLMGGDLTSHG
jgi:hypothetical protein